MTLTLTRQLNGWIDWLRFFSRCVCLIGRIVETIPVQVHISRIKLLRVSAHEPPHLRRVEPMPFQRLAEKMAACAR